MKKYKDVCLFILRRVVDPFSVIKLDKLSFFLWFTFTVFAGQLGIVVNILIRKFGHSMDVGQSIYLDSASGIFYTFSIALAASALGPLFANFITNKSKVIEFTSLKIISIVFIIFFLIFSSIIYASVQKVTLAIGEEPNLVIDWPQLLIYVIAIFISTYAYCLIRIKKPEYAHLDDNYRKQADKSLKVVITKSRSLSQDKDGNKL